MLTMAVGVAPSAKPMNPAVPPPRRSRVAEPGSRHTPRRARDREEQPSGYRLRDVVFAEQCEALVERLADEEHHDPRGDREERANVKHLLCVEPEQCGPPRTRGDGRRAGG